MDEAQVSRLKRSVEEWNGWRGQSAIEVIDDEELRKHGRAYLETSRFDHLSIDLSYADLRNLDLRGANLTNSNMSFADVSGSDLSSAALSGAQLQFVKFNPQTKWPKNVQLPGSALFDNGPEDGITLNRTSRSGAFGSRELAFEASLVELFSVLTLIQRALPERPNDSEQLELLSIVNTLSEKVIYLQEKLDRKEETVANLERELAAAKKEAGSFLNVFIRKSTESLAEQVGPTIKWLVTSSSVTAIATTALKSFLGQ